MHAHLDFAAVCLPYRHDTAECVFYFGLCATSRTASLVALTLLLLAINLLGLEFVGFGGLFFIIIEIIHSRKEVCSFLALSPP